MRNKGKGRGYENMTQCHVRGENIKSFFLPHSVAAACMQARGSQGDTMQSGREDGRLFGERKESKLPVT